MRRVTAAVLVLATMMIACRHRSGVVRSADTDLLAAALDIVTIDSTRISGGAAIGRNVTHGGTLNPCGGPGLSGVEATFQVQSQGSVPAGLEAGTLTVFHGAEMWQTTELDNFALVEWGIASWHASDGPDWHQGDSVDVVLELRKGDAHALLRSPRRAIR